MFSESLGPGLYTVSEMLPVPAEGWSLTGIECLSDTGGAGGSTFTYGGDGVFTVGDLEAGIQLAAGDSVTCTFTNTKRGKITINKTSIGGDGTFNYSSPTLGGFDITTTGGSGTKMFPNLLPGTFEVTETGPSNGFQFTSLSCDGGIATVVGATATIDLGPGDNVTCTYVNTLPKGGTEIEVTKLVNGKDIPKGTSFTFEIRTLDGAVLASDTVQSGDPVADFEPTTFSNGEYLLCEVGAGPDWNSTLLYADGAFHPIIEVVDPETGELVEVLDFATVCVPFEITDETGPTLTFEVDNTPGIDPRTIGYWKNHCQRSSGGGGRGGKRNPNKTYIVDLEGSVILGDLVLETGDDANCAAFTNILDKRVPLGPFTGRNRASDPAYNMAAQLTAAQLNYLNSGTQCVGAGNAIEDGIQLLTAIGFNGMDLNWRDDLDALGLTSLANELAEVLDDYNNDRFGEACGYEDQLPLDEYPLP